MPNSKDAGVLQALNGPLFGGPAVERIGWALTASGPALLVSLVGAPILSVDTTLDDEISIGGPDSGGTKRLFQGRIDGARNVIETVPRMIGAQADALGKAEDSVAASGDVGVPAYAVRQDAEGAVAADGDYTPVLTDATGRLKVDATGGGGDQFARDSVAGVADLGTMALVVRADAPGASVGTDGDYSPLQVDATGQLRVGGAAPTGLGKAQNAIAAGGDVGVPALAIRNDSPSSGVVVNDYDVLKSDSSGRLHTRALTGGGTSGTTTVVAVGAASTSLVVGPAPTMACATIQNRGPGPLYIHVGVGPALATNFFLANGDREQFFCSPGVGIFGISNAAGASAVVIVESP